MGGDRTGIGYDVHRTAPGRDLMLGGVKIPESPFGLEGHSDADVVLHAIADACLGGAGLGDIGTLFPNTDPEWKGADSADLLTRVRELVEDAGWRVASTDVTIIAEEPRLAPHVPSMKRRIAELLNITANAASVKATTHEGLGPLGRAEGIAALAVVSMEPRTAGLDEAPVEGADQG